LPLVAQSIVHSRITSAKRFLPEFDHLAALPFCSLSFFINHDVGRLHFEMGMTSVYRFISG